MKKKILFLGVVAVLVFGTVFDVTAQAEPVMDEELLFMEIPTVITASKFTEKLSDAPGVISVITKDELERFGGTTLKDILERVPSLIGSSVYMTDRSMISVRGDQFKNSGSHVLLLINGRPIREIQEGGIKSETLESFPINIIEKIEVIRGPGSVLYGSGAFSGVVNIITEKAEENDITMTGLGGKASAYDTQGKAKYRNGDLSIVAAGRYHKKPDWNTTLDYLSSYNPASLDPTGNLVSAEVDIPNKGPGVYLGVNYKKLSFMSTYNEWESSHFIPEFCNLFHAYGDNDVWKKGFADMGYAIEVNEKWNMDINLTYTRSKLKIPFWPSTSRDSYEFIAECANFINPVEKLGVVFGGLYNYAAGKEKTLDEGTISDSSQNNFALYTQADYWVQQDIMKLIGGLQANKVENIGLDIVPRAGLIFYPVSYVNVKTLYSRAFRAPSINEIGINYSAMQGNPDCKPEKVDTVDIGVNYIGKKIQGGVNLFYSKQTDIILQDRTFTKFSAPTYDNIGEIIHRGIEIEGKYYVNKEFLLLGSALHQESKDKDGNKDVTPIANNGAKAGISYKSEKGATVSLFSIYQGGLDEKYDVAVNPSPGAYNIMNLNCRFDMNKLSDWNVGKGLSLLFRVDNLFDREVWVPNWGLILGNSLPVNQGRTIYLGAEIAF
ncbi:MAG: TonB-dependent receptor [Elusimicrobia bacterium]|nr:TonB-dependent receptor [Elusimicrobiota bacterium]